MSYHYDQHVGWHGGAGTLTVHARVGGLLLRGQAEGYYQQATGTDLEDVEFHEYSFDDTLPSELLRALDAGQIAGARRTPCDDCGGLCECGLAVEIADESAFLVWCEGAYGDAAEAEE